MDKYLTNLRNSKLGRSLGQFLSIGIIVLAFTVTTPTFRTMDNVISIGLSAAIYILLAMGLSFVLIAGATDLSAGSVVAISGITCAVAIRDFGMGVAMGVMIGLLTGILCGIINGLLSTKLGLVPFIATLGTQWIFRGLTNILGKGMPVSVRIDDRPEIAEQFYFIGGGRIFGIPVPVYICIVFGIVLAFVLKKTVFGRNVYAAGSNDEAARLSGIDVFKTQMIAYMICDGMAGLAGVVMAARLVSAQTSAGTGYEFEGIFAAVIGGVSLSGGLGNILGAVIGALIVAVLRNGLNLHGVNSFWQQVILGVLIVGAVWLDVHRSRKQAGATH
ncbi:ABC transporter permease [Diplocloster agilis]|uniref:ABC transporter permease n=1 Tax=Diplocloster agilis TaxID=2850323 RepID=UPI0008206366|nr:ABC transporter permease [Suonthocola fibrivorans]MCU6735858.1 ABC transporter permease [Suonthocola fibrivorans]SCJ83253.1 Ribose transport system permease protein rbsC [uncultured Clostridium sp.]